MSASGCAAFARGSRHKPTRRAADWLHLAAAPTFAIMAMLTGALGGDQRDMLCTAAAHGSLLGGMVPMYLLMSAFHLRPWLTLISGHEVSDKGR